MERNTPKPETAEQLGQQLLEFVDKAEFGKPEFQAISDYLELQTLYSLGELEISRLASESEDKPKRESDIRILEARTALMEHQIEQSRSRVPGYSKSFQFIETGFENIYSWALSEAVSMYAYPLEQERYARQLREVAYEGAHEIISTKRDAS